MKFSVTLSHCQGFPKDRKELILQYLSGLRHDVGVDLDGLGAEGVGVAIGWVPGKEGHGGGKGRVLRHGNRKESGTDGATKWRRRRVFGIRKTFMATYSFVFIETSLVQDI